MATCRIFEYLLLVARHPEQLPPSLTAMASVCRMIKSADCLSRDLSPQEKMGNYCYQVELCLPLNGLYHTLWKPRPLLDINLNRDYSSLPESGLGGQHTTALGLCWRTV
jgi:hypothetical protein